ncbi:hypothetical protein TYRP_013632 [Tyrophagus putrescentiae]|nr:hypothetical protein TYRP_013632 [Tyrophagus putrescentiae]
MTYPGCCCESEETKIHRKINQKIEHQLRKEKRNSRKHIKLLLLGTGESGKSTFIRQMRIIHEHGYDSVHERMEYVPRIHQNLLTTLYSLTHAMNMLHIEYASPEIATAVDLLLRQTTNYSSVISWREQFLEQLSPEESFTDSPTSCSIHIMCLSSYQSVVQLTDPLRPEHLKTIELFWNDVGVQICSKRRNEFNLMDSSVYYMARLEEILTDGYVPTVQDILRVRIPTNGINEYTFSLDTINFLIVDVGGQRTERRKWIHCFENVTSIIFLVALNEFDQVLSEPVFPMYLTWRAKALAESQSESPSRQKLNRKMSQMSTANTAVNRLEESKALFKTIVTCEWFRHSSVILFLNKYDLFEDKILYGPNRLSDYFPAYSDGDRDPAAAADFILELFYQAVDLTVLRKRVVYSHFTCATDTRNMRVVFQAVKETILDQMLCKEIQIF